MISVSMLGRNDSHGYNMHKRIAICLNSIAHLMEDPDDEILFVDCNTRNDLPTVLESIADTLTEKTKEHLRIFRLRPVLFKKYSLGSKLPISESLSKNIAIRRSNEKNKWFLTTTSDIVVLPRDGKQSLSRLSESLQNGFYGLPRFGIPEVLWGTLSRNQPEDILSSIRQWGNKFHLNNAVKMDRPEILYDAPGDFQLCLREQLFEIYGFDERMIHCWHQDSNLGKRLYLLNGETRSLLDHAYCYHCDHTWEVDYLHRGIHDRLVVNDENLFVFDLKTPLALHQADSWGLIHEDIEEIRLDAKSRHAVFCQIEMVMPDDTTNGYSEEYLSGISYNSSLFYKTDIVLPFIMNTLEYIKHLKVLYVGDHSEMVQVFWKLSGALKIDYLIELEFLGTEMNDRWSYKETFSLVEGLDISDKVMHLDFVLVDLFYKGSFTEPITGIHIPVEGGEFDRYKMEMTKKLEFAVLLESQRIEKGLPPAKFVFIGLQHTWAEAVFSHHFNLAHTQYASHVTFGSLRYFLEKKKKDQTEEIRVLENQVKDLENKVSHLMGELQSVYSSRAWRIALILKQFFRLIR